MLRHLCIKLDDRGELLSFTFFNVRTIIQPVLNDQMGLYYSGKFAYIVSRPETEDG